MAITAERVNAIANEQGLYDFMRQELGWPIDGQPATFEFYADELGLTEAAAGKIGSVRQIAPFETGQPWGVFLVVFDNAQGRVYQTALRRVLRGLSETRRDQDASLPAWKAENLLFFCTPNYKDWTIARFEGKTHTRATLSLFGWEHGDTALRTLCEHNLRALIYPADPADADAWLKQWAGAFDVKKVTDRFFDAYRDVFKAFENDLSAQIPNAEARRMFTQTLFNRLMFCWFLQKKGWLYRHKNYLPWQWDFAQKENGKGASDKRHNFYAEYLQPLFFHLLNTPHGERGEQAEQVKWEAQLGDIPFLNGGLFDPSKDAVPAASVTIPNAAFAPVLNLFATHNFTVEESTPLEIAVAIDPEMLGKVFEELVTGRHESGSYYTPRPIVAFMCREALKGYLAHSCPNESAAQIAAFVDAREGAKATDLNAPEVVFDALRRVRVCDPACGSGAYLLGMMQELLRLRDSLFAAVKKDYAQVYRRKLEIIQRNLYGVDMDAFATNIAMLRLWLSLIVDNDAPLDDVLSGAANVSLPNLRFKIQTNDSLGAFVPDASTFTLFNEQYAHDAHELSGLYDEYFAPPQDKTDTPHKRGKDMIEADIMSVQARIAKLLGSQAPETAVDWCVQFAEVFAPQLALATIGGAFNFGQELVETPEPGGFDIVLANPPYVRQELIKTQKPILQKMFKEVYAGTADLYCFFYARAVQLLRQGGMMAFISPNKWFRAAYGANLRKFIADKCHVHSITDFGDLPVFEDATTYPMIFVAGKNISASPKGRENPAVMHYTQIKSLDAPYPDVLAVVQRDGGQLPTHAIQGAEWTLTSATNATRLHKMEQSGIPLGQYVNGQIYYGVKTGFNEAFVISGDKRTQLIAEDPRSAELIKPLAVGRDIRRWHVANRDTWLIFTRRGVDIDVYPAIKAHLCQWQSELTPKEKGDEKKGRAIGRYNWYEIQADISYYKAFDSPKIVYPDIALEARFAFDKSGTYLGNTSYFFPCNDLYVLGVLNSQAVADYYIEKSAQIRGGYLRFFTQYVERIPIPTANSDERATIASLVQKCLDNKGADCHYWQQEINYLVANLYNL